MENNYKKILLINPPSEFTALSMPMGLACIAAYLKAKITDIDISVIDAWGENLEFEELEKRITQTQADIIGIYMTSPRYDETKKTCEMSRRIHPKALIIVGGPHSSAVPAETLQEIPEINICAIGEGEITMYELVKGYPLPEINGIAYRDGNEIKLTRPREFIKNLDELPFPARELFPIEKYKAQPPFGRKMPWLFMVTSRGCPYQCAYCSKDVFKDSFRALSPKKVCDEIEELISKYDAKEIYFSDDDFTLDMKRAEGICDEIMRRGIKISWSCFTRVNLINELLLKKMKKAGCWIISYGVESGNQKILDNISKGIKIEQIISAFELTRKTGISTICSFMMGLPGETKETIRDTVNLVKRIKPTFIGCGVLIVYPGSRFFKFFQQGKYQGKLRTLNRLNPSEGMPGVFFRGNYTVFEDNLTFEELRTAIRKAVREFYFRPQYFWEAIRGIRSFSDFKCNIIGSLLIAKSALIKR